MRILFLNPFHGGSHAAVAEGFARFSSHQVTLETLSIAGGWRWRMRGAAVTLARRLPEITGGRPAREAFDLLLTTDMLDLATFLGLTSELTAGLPIATYFHENQLTYPLPSGRTRDLAFPWINYTTALASDAVLFNSNFHRQAFLTALPELTGRFHDHQEFEAIAGIAANSHVMPPGIDLARLDGNAPAAAGSPVILWNSRWEYDKQPEAFFAALAALERRGIDFRLIIIGEHIDPRNPAFTAAYQQFAQRALAWGYADAADYARLLHQADIIVSTALQEFFGIALIEALYCGATPIVPRRLSYPELLPPELHADCLYDNDADLVDKLAAAIANIDQRRNQNLRRIAAAYDWSVMAPRYDALLEEFTEPS